MIYAWVVGRVEDTVALDAELATPLDGPAQTAPFTEEVEENSFLSLIGNAAMPGRAG